MKIYISGPMTGHPELNYPAFNRAAEHFRKRGHAVLNPAVHPDGLTYREYLQIDMAMLFVAEAIFMLPNWTESKGAEAEAYLSRVLGLFWLNEKYWMCENCGQVVDEPKPPLGLGICQFVCSSCLKPNT